MGVSRGIPSGHKMEGLGGLKKGAWSKEEDDVLRQFIEKHGEGKWHQIPPKAGLNRCRKSCRLRWLNHLKPTINKGDFTEDEIDLMLRLHKLLGNRWSLIAGRLPGRTANDVKNYWNARLRKKMNFGIEKLNDESRQTTKSIIIRPRPRTLKKSSHHSVSIAATLEHAQSKNNFSRPFPSSPPIDNGIDWWKAILYDTGSSVERVTCSSSLGLEEDPFTNCWVEDDMKQLQSTRTSVAFDDQEGLMSRSDLFLLSMDLWNISEEERIKISIERP